jgi:hypothetical protein
MHCCPCCEKVCAQLLKQPAHLNLVSNVSIDSDENQRTDGSRVSTQKVHVGMSLEVNNREEVSQWAPVWLH